MSGIATGGGHRGQGELGWSLKAAIFSFAAILSGAALGATLGFCGSQLPAGGRVTGGSVVVLLLATWGLANLLGRGFGLPQRDCETAQVWLSHGAIGWAIRNGAALGSGFFSRIGFLSWYLVPLGAAGSGDPLLGAAIFGLYSGSRCAAVWVWILVESGRAERDRDLGDIMVALNPLAKQIGDIYVVAACSCAAVILGL